MLCFHVETIDLHLYRVVNQHPVYAGWCDDTPAVNLVLIAWSPAVVRLSYQRENLTYRYESREESNPYGCESIDEQGRACGEGVVKTPAPRTLRAMRNFAIKKSPPHGQNHARGGCPHALMGVGLRPETGHCEPTQRDASDWATLTGLSPIHVRERLNAPLPLNTDSGAPAFLARLMTVTFGIDLSTSSV